MIEITLKMHGTSGRTARLPVFKGYRRTLLDRILRREGTPIYEDGYVSGTRRVVLEDFNGGFYGSNEFREQHSKFFEGKLLKGETVYYEVVGFTTSGTPIMADCANKKLNDKEFMKKYGETTTFSYGCEPPHSDIYVYRMTMTNEDGDVIEYTPYFMRYRCEQMGVKTVQVFDKFYIPEEQLLQSSEDGSPVWVPVTNPGEYVLERAERYFDGPDPVGKTHIREGVVVRIINRPKFCAYKHKNHTFKMLSGIAIADAEASGKIELMDADILAEL